MNISAVDGQYYTTDAIAIINTCIDATAVHSDVVGIEGISPRIADNDLAAMLGVGSCEELDGYI